MKRKILEMLVEKLVPQLVSLLVVVLEELTKLDINNDGKVGNG